MSIKLINHRRRLLHKRAYISPHKRHKSDKYILNKAEKRKLNKEKKLAAKSKSNRKNKPNKKSRRNRLKLPYRFKDYQLQPNDFRKNSLNNLVKQED